MATIRVFFLQITALFLVQGIWSWEELFVDCLVQNNATTWVLQNKQNTHFAIYSGLTKVFENKSKNKFNVL